MRTIRVRLLANRRAWIFAAALATIFMAAIEATIVATAMPTIVGDLGGLDRFSWLFSAYLLTQAVTIPIYGRLADLHGRKPVLLFGIAVFLVGSVLCGCARDMNSLIAFRVIQGIGAGSLVPVSQTLVGDIYSGEQRARMQGYVSSTFGSAAILGPPIGSFLVAHADWSLVFWINVPLGIAAGILIHVSLKETFQKRMHRLDILGSLLMAAAIGTLMLALVSAAELSGSRLIVLLAVAGILFIALLFHERRVQEPMLPLRLMTKRIVAAGNAVCLLNGVIMMSIVAMLPAYMQGVMRSGAMLAGTALGAMSFAWPVGGFVGSRLMLWFSYRIAATIGAVVLVAGSLLMIALDAQAGAAQPIGAALLMGFGLGVTNICFVIAIQANVDLTQRGIATSTVSFTRIVGQSLGTAIFGGILNLGLSKYGDAGKHTVARLMQPGQTLDLSSMDGLLIALTNSLQHIYVLSSVLAFAVLAIVLFLPSHLRLTDQPARH